MCNPYEYDEQDDWEAAAEDCGIQDDGPCLELGTEYCGFMCPFRSAAWPEDRTTTEPEPLNDDKQLHDDIPF